MRISPVEWVLLDMLLAAVVQVEGFRAWARAAAAVSSDGSMVVVVRLPGGAVVVHVVSHLVSVETLHPEHTRVATGPHQPQGRVRR